MKDKIPILIKGKKYADQRGELIYNNDFDLTEVKRYFTIKPSAFRAWHGHKNEQNWINVVRGAVKILLIEPDNWKNPSHNLPLSEYILKEEDGDVLYIPGGYISGIKSIIPDSKLVVFSNFTLEESLKDDYRFSKERWYFESFM
ncbi:cupin domain-containing protein [Salinimicrobium sp. CAU 1759]